MASRQEQIVVAFDLYGTLLSTESIAKQLASHFGDAKAAEAAALWRRYQLEYTWRLNSMKQYHPFSTITSDSLRHVLAELKLSLDDAGIEKLMEAYDSLSVFPDIPRALEAIRDLPWITPVVFSNGTPAMVTKSVNSSPDLSPYASVFKRIITVEAVQRFKPDPVVYYHLAEQMGKTTREELGNIWLVSGNPFDVVGARAVGMKAAWVNRTGGVWTDQVMPGDEGHPTIAVKSLGEVVDGLKRV